MIKTMMSTMALAMVAANDDTIQFLLQSRRRDDLLILEGTEGIFESQEDETVLKRDFGLVTSSHDIGNASIEETGLHDGQLAETGNVAMEEDWREEDADVAIVPHLPIDDLQQRPEFSLIALRMNVSHELSKCEVSDVDIAKASLSAVEKFLDEPEFCWRKKVVRKCRLWNPSKAVFSPMLGLPSPYTYKRCPNSKKFDKCCDWGCPEGFYYRGTKCWQQCKGATPYSCGNLACSQNKAAHVAAIANMVVSVADSIRSTLLLVFPVAKVASASIKVVQQTSKKALQQGAKAAFSKMKKKLKNLATSANERARVFQKVRYYLRDKPGWDINCGARKKYFDIVVGQILKRANGKSEADMEAFDFTEFEPTGFATAIRKSAEAESPAEQNAAWLGAAGAFDPTGWLSAAASFAKPHCETVVADRYMLKLSTGTAEDHLDSQAGTTSRVEASFDNENYWQQLDGDLSQGSTNTFSLMSLSKSPQSVTVRIRGTDAWAFNSLKIDNVEWLVGLMKPNFEKPHVQWLNNPVTDASHWDMAYKRTARTQVTVLAPRPAYYKDRDHKRCLNRGAAGDSNKYSINVGPNNLGACASRLNAVEGCGRWFDYGSKDGWCNCVPETSGACQAFFQTGAEDYAVYKLQFQPAYDRHTRNACCQNRGGVGGSNKYSINVGPNNLAACAAHLNGVDGCGRWFDYGFKDGWCDCVPERNGVCDGTFQEDYAVFKFQIPPAYAKHTDKAYCHNRGGDHGRNKYSSNVGPNNPAACAAYVIKAGRWSSNRDGCGRWFEYGSKDGWCNCVPETSGVCFPSATADYAVYKLELSPAHQWKQFGAYCRNRGGVGGSNKYSINVGPNNLAACAAHLNGVDGCGRWFDYGMKDGWCDCVPETSGVCTHAFHEDYAVHKFDSLYAED